MEDDAGNQCTKLHRPNRSKGNRDGRTEEVQENSPIKGRTCDACKTANRPTRVDAWFKTMGTHSVKVVECDEFFVQVLGDGWDKPRSIPMDKIRIGQDRIRSCLELMEYD
jgi:hypothetical protein